MLTLATNALPRSPLLLGWLALWCVLGSLGFVVALDSADGGDPALAVQEARGELSATLGGVTATVTSMEETPTRAFVVIEVSGTPERGQTLSMLGRAALSVGGGPEATLVSGETSGRRLTLIFSGLPDREPGTQLVLRLEGLALSTKPFGESIESDRTLIGSFILTVPSEFVREAGGSTDALDLSAPYGPGLLRVQAIVREADAIVVRGRFEGIPENQIPAIRIRPTVLVDSKGVPHEFIEARTGYGDGLADFEFRFRLLTAGEPVRLEVAFTIDESATTGSALEALRAASREPARVDLVTPE